MRRLVAASGLGCNCLAPSSGPHGKGGWKAGPKSNQPKLKVEGTGSREGQEKVEACVKQEGGGVEIKGPCCCCYDIVVVVVVVAAAVDYTLRSRWCNLRYIFQPS